MSKKSVLILCAGLQQRWEKEMGIGYKQLLLAGSETILGRIVRQVIERGHEPCIVTNRSVLTMREATLAIPLKRRWKVESILDVKRRWGSCTTLILLGDVIYQGHVMNRIFDHNGIDMFFGNYAEIFAYYFHRNINVEMFLRDTIVRCENNGDNGTLHSLFRAYIGDFDSPNIEKKKDTSLNFTHVTGDGGWTRDIDTPADYKLFIDQVVLTGKLDDLATGGTL